MMRIIRTFIAAAALAALSFNLAHAQAGPATITFNDPNCGSWGMTQSGSSFTLTCQSLTCSIGVSPAAPLPADAVTLTANCAGASGSAAYAWSKTSGPLGCPAVPANGNPAALSAAGSTMLLCVYKVAVTDGANGAGSATTTVNWTATPPASPTGCSVAFTAGSANLASTGGAIAMIASCTGNTNANTTWSWTKNGAAFGSGTTASDTLPANTLTTAVSTTYQVTATNAGATPTVATQAVTVAGVGGGGTTIDLSACTAAGYVGHGVDIPYPLSVNSPRVYTDRTVGNFGSNDMIVVRFVAPVSEVSVGSRIVASEYSIYPAVNRLATLSTSPCVVATAPGASGSILASSKSQAPSFDMALLGTGTFAQIKLAPGATYYVNYVNRDYYNNPSSSCTTNNCAMYIDFQN